MVTIRNFNEIGRKIRKVVSEIGRDIENTSSA